MKFDLSIPERVALEILPAPAAPAVAARVALTDARSDSEIARTYLDGYPAGSITQENLRKDVERFLMWLRAAELQLADVRIEQVRAWQAFIRAPHPDWCSARRVPRRLPDGAPNPEWRPFLGALAESSARKCEQVVAGFMQYCVHAGYLGGNPWKLLPRTQKAPTTRGGKTRHEVGGHPRALDRAAMTWLSSWLDELEARPKDPRVPLVAARARWMIALLFYTGARRGEAVGARMQDIRRIDGQWWLLVDGKTGRGDIPLPDGFIRALVSWRRSLGCTTDLPEVGDERAILTEAYRGERALSGAGLYKALKTLLADCALDARDAAVFEKDLNRAAELREIAARLESASPHWFRHTAASWQVNEAGIDMLLVSRNLRHGSLDTTKLYVADDWRGRHEATQAHELPGRRLGG